MPTHLNTHTFTYPTFQNAILVITPPCLSLSTLSTPPQHSHHVPVPGTIVLPSTIPRYILPTPPSYYHAACLLRPCSFLISSSDAFSIYCLTPRNHFLQYRLGSLPCQPNGTITSLRNNNQFYPSIIPILSLVKFKHIFLPLTMGLGCKFFQQLHPYSHPNKDYTIPYCLRVSK